MAILDRQVLRGPIAGGFRLLAVGAIALGVLLHSARSAQPTAAPAPTAEYQVKAGFLFNFAQFVEWPGQAFADRKAPLVIGILGDDPFGSYLDEMVREESVAGRPLLVRRFRQPEEIQDCHILFVSASEATRVERIVVALKGRSILTVGDSENFSQQGGIVRLVMESGKIRLRINVDEAREAGLIISSKILRPASIVTKEKR